MRLFADSPLHLDVKLNMLHSWYTQMDWIWVGQTHLNRLAFRADFASDVPATKDLYHP
jgi:hypothetical protein